MSLERNIEIKKYICSLFVNEDEILKTVRTNSKKERLPDIQVPSNVGKLLYMLTKLHAPKRVLEIGTLGGYSTIWIARAMGAEGRIISLDIDAHNIRVAKEHLALAGLQERVEIRFGRATELLQQMVESKEEPFDLIFIDADKVSYPDYLEYAVKLSSPGTLILSDNLIPKGGEIGGRGPDMQDEEKGIYKFNQQMASHPRLETILIPTIVGEKGRIDALGLSIVT
ncbi:MAG: O-methyltransferase [Chlamydiales bacterium]|nr:O-methyltransferase [Chlamydiales bacterium]